MINGQKAFNERRKTIQVQKDNVIRIWLFQNSKDGLFANFNLIIIAKEIDSNSTEEIDENDCDALDIPKAFGLPRYNLEEAMTYFEKFRIDNIPHNEANHHDIAFQLK